MEIVDKIFDGVLVVKGRTRVDGRGTMTVICGSDFEEVGFRVAETRSYVMPRTGSFFGIHYRDESDPMIKVVTVISGRGMDSVVDLRPNSPTYLQWKGVELSADEALTLIIPAGFGQTFLSMEENTILMYSTDKTGKEGYSKTLNYKEPRIGLTLPMEVTEISDYDRDAPYLDEKTNGAGRAY